MTAETGLADTLIEQAVRHNPAIYELQHYFRNREDALNHLRDVQPSDELILEFIGNAFGIWGGGSRQTEGWYEYKGGKHPHIEVKDRGHVTTHKLDGQRLIDAFRLIFAIPAGNQLSLF